MEKLFDNNKLTLKEAAFYCDFISKSAIAEAFYLTQDNEDINDCLQWALFVLHHKLNNGDICVKLEEEAFKETLNEWRTLLLTKEKLTPEEELFLANLDKFKVIPFADFLKTLNDCEVIGSEQDDKPLLISRNRLYLRRYFNYERKIAAYIVTKSKKTVSQELLSKAALMLNLLFPSTQDSSDIDWQKVAAAMPILSYFSVISGGPGTGKTTTVLRILLLLRALFGLDPKIMLAAPTGKAAARMAQSISEQLEREKASASIVKNLGKACGYSVNDLINSIPSEAKTVHSLLNLKVHQVTPYFNETNPLDCDVLVVDEVSMVDLSLFYKLISALKPTATLIMLGDKDQLSSVEAGSVLGDICSHLTPVHSDAISKEKLENLSKLTGYKAESLCRGQLSDYVALLLKSYRFGGLIGALAKAINLDNNDKKLKKIKDIIDVNLNDKLCTEFSLNKEEILKAPNPITFMEVKNSDSVKSQKFLNRLAKLCVQKQDDGNDNYFTFLEYLKAHKFTLKDEDAKEAFSLMDKFRVLCSNHHGLLGDRSINLHIEKLIKDTYKLSGSDFFPGKIVLITKNDSLLNVHNGDVGFIAYDEDVKTKTRSLKVYLKGPDKILKISPLFLKDHESGFAMSIHKSQGSEYARVLIALSMDKNPVLTKELVYTGVTRAKQSVSIVSSYQSFNYACLHSVRRESGLALRIADPADVTDAFLENKVEKPIVTQSIVNTFKSDKVFTLNLDDF